MKLDNFIREALLNIVNGVESANNMTSRFKLIGVKHESGIDGIYADFDVSVMVNEKDNGGVKTKAKVSLLNVVSAEVGVNSDQNSSYQNTHRLKFKVFISEKR